MRGVGLFVSVSDFGPFEDGAEGADELRVDLAPVCAPLHHALQKKIPDSAQSSAHSRGFPGPWPPGIAGILARVDHGRHSAVRGLQARDPRDAHGPGKPWERAEEYSLRCPVP